MSSGFDDTTPTIPGRHPLAGPITQNEIAYGAAIQTISDTIWARLMRARADRENKAKQINEDTNTGIADPV